MSITCAAYSYCASLTCCHASGSGFYFLATSASGCTASGSDSSHSACFSDPLRRNFACGVLRLSFLPFSHHPYYLSSRDRLLPLRHAPRCPCDFWTSSAWMCQFLCLPCDFFSPSLRLSAPMR